MRYLGIDYGKKKVGLAISEGLTASPLKILEVSSLKDAINKVGSVIKAEGIELVVIGVPESGEARKIAEQFILELGKQIKVAEVEETLSSKDARDQMLNLNLSKKVRLKEDSFAAANILQNYLDLNQNV